MKTIKNLYLRSLEIGYTSKNEGIAFNALVMLLVSEGYYIERKVFREWYFANFENEYRRQFVVDPCSFHDLENISDDQKHSLCSDSFMQYVEYLELKEARQSSKQAMRVAIGAIIISAVLAATSIGISLYGIICR